MVNIYRGTCFCGAVEIEVRGNPVEMGYCHCHSCRSYTGSPLTAFTLWRDDDFRIVRGAKDLGAFNKVGTSNRRFCIRCGGHLFTEHPGLGFTDVYAPVLAEFAFKPMFHLNYADSILKIRDGLPKLKDFPVHAGGSGEQMPEVYLADFVS